MSEFGNLLKECRKKIGLTQKELGKNINVCQSEYVMYETGFRFPNKEKYNKLDEHFNFEQFENVKEAIIDNISDYIDSLDMYELFQLERELNLKILKK